MTTLNRSNEMQSIATVTITALIVITERYEDIEALYLEYSAGLKATGQPYELIYIIDGQYPTLLSGLKAIAGADRAVRILNLPRSYGEATCLSAGHDYASGRVIITLPAFHQINASEIPKLIEAAESTDLVVACRWPRQDSLFTRIQSKIFTLFVNYISGLRLNDAGCTVRAFKKHILNEIELYGDFHRFLPVLAKKQGFEVQELKVEQDSSDKRFRLYSPGVYLRRILDLLSVYFIYRFTRKPFRFFGLVGAAFTIPGVLLTSWLIFERLFFGVGLANRPVFLVSTLLIVFGIQIAAVGLIGEMIIFRHAKQSKEYRIREIIDFTDAKDNTEPTHRAGSVGTLE